jgi:hypothetical protein
MTRDQESKAGSGHHTRTSPSDTAGVGPGKQTLTEALGHPAGASAGVAAAHHPDVDQGNDASPADVKLVAGRPPRAQGGAEASGAAGPEAEAARAQPVLDLDAAIQRYAPLVYLAKGEKYEPASADAFIQNSRLRWSHDAGAGDDEIADPGKIDEAKLGGKGKNRSAYTDQVESQIGSIKHGRHIRSDQDVRPNDGKGDGGNEGFFLDLANSKRGSLGSTRSPVYYEAKAGHYITYWFFYAYNDGPFPGGADNHEGDWERISVKLDGTNRATAVSYYQHEGSKELRWGQVPKQGSHPIVYSARGSHASYARPGTYGLQKVAGHPLAKDHASQGQAWATWKNLKNAQQQAWYGYGGAWGEVGNPDVDAILHDETTGPQGPSQKKPAPDSY